MEEKFLNDKKQSMNNYKSNNKIFLATKIQKNCKRCKVKLKNLTILKLKFKNNKMKLKIILKISQIKNLKL